MSQPNPSEKKHVTQLQRRIRDLEAAVLNMLICPGQARGAGQPHVGGLCEQCRATGQNLLHLRKTT